MVRQPLSLRAAGATLVNKLINFGLMQINWFACVLGAADGRPWLGVIVALAIATARLLRSRQLHKELKFLVAALLFGFVLDSALASTGLIAFSSGTIVDGVTTPWMLGLWIGFATTLNGSLTWLLRHPTIAVIFGAVGGPLTYWSGAKLGALTMGPLIDALIPIGIGWAIAMACFAKLSKRLSSHQSTDETAKAVS
jgi:hypothetical protein